MRRRLLITLATASSLSGLFLLYAAMIRPLLTIAAVSPKMTADLNTAATSRPVENVEMAEAHLPQAAWAKTAKYHVRTDEIFIYADEWEPTGNEGYIRFSPFAAIWVQPDHQGREQVYSIVSDSAQLKFASNFNIQNPTPGRVIGGAMEGEVRITGPNGLSLLGRNFYFSESALRIWSDNPVQFAYGPHKGKAGKLQAELIPAEGLVSQDRPAVVGIRSLRLRQNVETVMSMPQRPGQEPQPPISIQCSGSLEYLFEDLLAIYENDVVAFHQSGPKEFDYLRSDRMTVGFEPKAASPNEAAGTVAKAKLPPAADSPEAQYQHIETDLEFRRMYAEGKLVTAISQSRDLKIEMASLLYDAKQQLITLTGRKMVNVNQRQKQTELEVPEILLQLTAGGQLESALCRGAGWLVNRDPITREIAFAADWQKHLRKITDPETKLDVLELEQQASCRQPLKQTALGADLIRLWLTPIDPQSSLDPQRANSRAAANPHPKRMLATQNVGLVSPQLEARTKQLEVVFGEVSASQNSGVVPIGQQSRDPLPPALNRRESGSLAAALNGANGPQSAGVVKTSAEKEAPRTPAGPPLDVAADAIVVRMQPLPTESANFMANGSGASRPEIEEVWTKGNVTVRQPRPNGKPPLELTGQLVHLVNRADAGQLAHVYGEPAHIRDNTMHLEGKALHLDRKENLAWVDGSGLLQLPVTRTPEGKLLDTPQLLDIWWKDRMTFDGLTARFDLDVKATLEQTRMTCQHMQVELNRRISFAQDQPTGQTPELKMITCRDGVDFDNHDYLDGKLSQVRKAHLWELNLNQQTGKILGTGPGWMQIWRRKPADDAEANTGNQVKSNRPLKSETQPWEFTRVDFAGGLQGNSQYRHISFEQRVEIVYGPVQRPVDTVRVDALPDDGGWMRCDRMQITQQPGGEGQPATSQLLGSGNAEIEGRTFRARSDQISYDEQKGLYMLRSLGNRTATIWRQAKVAANPSEVSAQRMEFYPKLNKLKLDRATGAAASE